MDESVCRGICVRRMMRCDTDALSAKVPDRYIGTRRSALWCGGWARGANCSPRGPRKLETRLRGSAAANKPRAGPDPCAIRVLSFPRQSAARMEPNDSMRCSRAGASLLQKQTACRRVSLARISGPNDNDTCRRGCLIHLYRGARHVSSLALTCKEGDYRPSEAKSDVVNNNSVG